MPEHTKRRGQTLSFEANSQLSWSSCLYGFQLVEEEVDQEMNGCVPDGFCFPGFLIVFCSWNKCRDSTLDPVIRYPTQDATSEPIDKVVAFGHGDHDGTRRGRPWRGAADRCGGE